MTPAGWIAISSGVVTSLASAAVGGGGKLDGAITAALVNPILLIGVPLGLYWLGKSRESRLRNQRGENPYEPPIVPELVEPAKPKPRRKPLPVIAMALSLFLIFWLSLGLGYFVTPWGTVLFPAATVVMLVFMVAYEFYWWFRD